MLSGTYHGPLGFLQGARALLREPSITKGEPDGHWMAQFDLPAGTDRHRPEKDARFQESPVRPYCYGWHAFPKGEFEVET